MAFDPDAFLLEEEPLSNKPNLKRFDPDEFLAEEEPVSEEPVIDRDYFKPKPRKTEKEKQEIGTIEGITNAARNAFDSSRQAISVVGGVSPEEAEDISKIEYEKKARKIAPGYDEYQKAEGMDAVWAFARNPIEVTSNIIAEGLAGSLPALGAGLAAGGVGAAIGAPTVIGAPIGFTAGQIAGTFAGSLATEYGSKVLEELQGEGMDISDPNSIQTFFGNEELMGKVRNKALTRGVPVAAFDAISAGIGGKLGRVFGGKVVEEGGKIIGKQFATKTGEALTELGVQAGLGAGGEVAGALAIGETPSVKAAFGEAIGEVGTGGIQVLTGRIADKRAMAKAQEDAKIKAAADLSTTLEENSSPLTASVVTAKSATNIEQDKLAAQLDEELTIQETAAAAAQPTTTDATKEIIQPEGVRKEPQDGTQIEKTAEAGQVDSTIFDLQSVANNTATREQISALSLSGLVDIRRGQAIINEDGEGILAQAQAPLPTLTPGERAAEVEGQVETPQPTLRDLVVSSGIPEEAADSYIENLKNEGLDDAQIGEMADNLKALREDADRRNEEDAVRSRDIARRARAGDKTARAELERERGIVTEEPTIGEIPKTSPMIGEQPAEPIISEIPTTSELVGEQPAEPIISEKLETSDIVGAEPATIVEQEQATTTEQISATAVLDKDGKILSSPSKTHAQIMEETKFDLDSGEFPPTQNFGFVTTTGRFVQQQEAQQIAQNAKQVQGNQPISGEIVSGLQRQGMLPEQTSPASEVSGTPTAEVAATDKIIEPKEQVVDLGNDIKADFIGQGDVIIKDKDGERVGRFESSSMENGLQAINITFLEEDYRGKGIGQKVVQKLKDIYGSIASDVISDMSKSAKSMWINAGAKIEQITEGDDIQSRYVLRKEPSATTTPAPAEVPAITPAPVSETPAAPETITFEKGDLVRIPNRVPVYENGQVVGGRTEMVGASVVQTMPDGKVEVRLQQGGYATLTPNEIELRRKTAIPTTPAVTEAPAAEVAPAPITRPAQEDVRVSRYRKFLGESAPQAISEAKNALSTFKTTMLGKRGDSPFQAEPRLRELKNVISLFVANRLNVTNQNADQIAEQIILGKPNIVDKVTELKPIKAKELDDIGANRSAIMRFGYELDDKKTYRHPREGEAITPTPAVSETITPTAEDISIGSRIKLGRSPQTYTVEEAIPQTEIEKANNEQSYSVKNERTGEVQVVEKASMKQVGGKKARKMAAERERITPRTPEETDAFNKASSNKVTARNPELAVAAVRLNNGEITTEEYADLIDTLNPFTTKGAESIPAKSKIDQYIDEGKKDKVNAPIENGKEVEFRIDIPTYNRSTAAGDTVYAVTAHEPVPETSKRVGTPISYVGAAKVINPKMMTRSISGKGEAIDIATGSGKFPLATVKGNYEAITELPADINDPNVWTEVSYNPIRSSYFVDVRSKNAVVGGSEAIMVGSRVFVKNPQMETRPQGFLGEDKRYMAEGLENQEVVTPIPEANRYTFEEAVKAVDAHFGKQGIPEGVVIVNNTIDKDLEMRAGYFVNRGQIVINLAYIAKGENLGDIIDHELGHYIFGDPKFQDDFKQFWDAMTPEEQAQADKIINQFYNQETGAIQVEEKQVRAFMQLIQESKAMPKWKQLLDTIKRWINEKLGTNFQVTDRGAMTVLAAAHKRFKSGEQIIREIDSGVLKMAAEQRREQVGGEQREQAKYITTPKGILAKNTDVIRQKFFDGTKVSPENTTEAWGYISQLLDIKSGNANELAGIINDTIEVELQARMDADIAAGKKVNLTDEVNKRVGAAMFSVELMNYAGRLADQGDPKMLEFLIRNINDMPVDNRAGGISEGARALRTRLEYDVSGFGAYTADQGGKIERTAATLFGTNKPGIDQVKAVKGAIKESDNTDIGDPVEIAGEIEKVEKRTKRNFVKKIESNIKESTEPKKEELLISFQNLNADKKIKGITLTYNPKKINPAKNIQDFIIGKLVDYRKTLINQGASGLESTFWQTMSDQERKPGPLGEIDQAQNNELAKIVQKTLIDLKLKGEPPDTKMTDIEKVASILNKQKLSEEKRIEADQKIVNEIQRRREGELESGSTPEAVNAKYDAILDAWNQAMSRQLNMPISDNMLQRLINAELKEQNTKISNLIEEADGKVVAKTKQGIVDSIIRKIYGVSKESDTGIEMDENYDGLKVYLEQTLDNMYALQVEKKNAAYADRQAKISLRNNIEGQAQSIIDQFANQLSDTPTFPQKQENQIKSIVQQDLRQRPDMKRKQPWTSQLTAKLINAGVNETQAQMISDLVWRQHEIKAMDREIKELQTAAEKGSLAVIIQRIKDTPLEEQQKPEWMQGVIREYLLEAGLSSQAADTAARLYESVIAERFAEAKQKAFEDTLAKSAPWNNYISRNSKLGKNALKKIQDAIRTGVLDPTQTTEGIIAKENGWSGFSKKQLTRIVQLDDIISNDSKDDITKAEAMAELNSIIAKAKMPVSFKDAIGAYYVAQALMGIPTLMVNIVSPVGFSVRNMITDIGKYSFTEPSRIPMAFETFLGSMKSWYNQTSYAFRNQIYMNDVVEYLQGQNVLRELFDKGKDQWAKGDYANGMANMLVGMTQITGRVLSSLDQGAISALENQNITRYAMEVMKQRNIPKDKRKEFANMIFHMRRKTYMENVSNGMDSDRAGVLADLAVRNEVRAALSEEGIRPGDVLESAINDALQTVGRNKTIDIDKLTGVTEKLSDSGVLAYYPIAFLEKIASGAAKEGPGMQVFSKMLYGFALVPARVFHTTAWYSPYGFVRLAIDKYRKNKGEESPYAMSLQTELQYKQRLTDAIAGSIVMLGLAALASSSTDDDEEKKFKIVITGNGPSYSADKQYFDAWHKKYKPYSFHIVMGDTIIPINIGRGGEALFFPVMLAGALDDWKIKEKLNLAKKEPKELNLAVEALGSAFFALAQRGPYSAFSKPLFDATNNGKITEELVGQAGFFGKTFIPIIGSSLSRNISDFINDPVERSSLQGAIYANTPVIGPWMGTKALNALGQPMRADDWGDKLFKLGVPMVFSFPKNTPENELNELILKKGSGPSIPTRSNAQKRFGDVLTDKEFETYVREYGRVVSDKMFKNRKKLESMSVKNYDDELEGYVRGYSIGETKITGASDMAVRAVRRSRNE